MFINKKQLWIISSFLWLRDSLVNEYVALRISLRGILTAIPTNYELNWAIFKELITYDILLIKEYT